MKQFIFILWVLLSHTCIGQELLTLEQAQKIALAQNGSIELSKMNAKAAAMQVYKANAGMGPRLDWNANFGAAYNKINQEFFDGRTIARNGRTLAPNTNITLNFPIIDKRLSARYETLSMLSEIQETAVRQNERDVKFLVSQQYYNIAKQKEAILFLTTTIKYYQDRLRITEERWNLGKGSKLDFLQSQNDVNIQLSQIKSAEAILKEYKMLLNLTLNRSADVLFDIEKVDLSTKVYNYDDILNKAIREDENLKILDQEITLNSLAQKELKGNKSPRLGLTSTLGYNLSSSTAGQFLLNQNLGINAGFSATWNLYDGNHINKQISISKLQSSIIEKEKENLIESYKSQIAIALNEYQAAKAVMELDEANKKIAEENLEIALEKFKLGASTILEVNDAQQRYDNAVNKYINGIFAVKNAELMLEVW